jgi:hypothetical protein
VNRVELNVRGTISLHTFRCYFILSLCSIFWGCSSKSTVTIQNYSAQPFCGASPTLGSGYAGGNGSVETPYQICLASELGHLMNTPGDWTLNFSLMQNIDLSTVSAQTPIGQMEITVGGVVVSSNPFSGSFNGGGYTITGLKINQSGDYNLASGLFAYIQNASIHDLIISGASITAVNYSGILVGVAENSDLTAVHVLNSSINYQANSDTAGSCIGGMIGQYIVNDGSSRTLSGSQVQITASANDLFGSYMGLLTLSGGSSLEIASVNVNSTVNGIAGGGNTFSGFIGYQNLANASVDIHDNVVNSSMTLLSNGSFSGGFSGTLICSPCTANFTGNSVNLELTTPAEFNGGYVGGFFGNFSPASGAVLNLNQNSVTGSLTLPVGSAQNRSGIGGFFGTGTIGNGVVAQLMNNSAQVNINIQSTGSTNAGGFAGALAVTGTGSLDFENNLAVGTQSVASPGINHGGMIGDLTNTGTMITNSSHSYYSSDDYSSGVGSGTPAYISGLSRAQLVVQANFIGWDFTNIWEATWGNFPFLR